MRFIDSFFCENKDEANCSQFSCLNATSVWVNYDKTIAYLQPINYPVCWSPFLFLNLA